MKPTKAGSHDITVSLSTLIELRWQAAAIDLGRHKRVATQFAGKCFSGFRGRGMELMEVRNYQAGDDIRHMDWRVTARTGRPHTKVYHEERERPVFVFVDYRDTMFFGTRVTFKSVIATKVAALIAWAAIHHEDRVGGFLIKQDSFVELPPRARQQGVLLLLKTLADISRPSDATEKTVPAFSQGLLRLRRIVKPGSLVFLLSDFYDFDQEAALQLGQLAQHNEVIAGFIYDPLEKNPPPLGYYTVTDGRQLLHLNTAEKQFCAAYREVFNKRLQGLQQALLRHRIPLLQLVTDQPVVASLYKQLCRN